MFFEKKTETGSNRPVLVRFGFLGQKPVQNGVARFFRFWVGFLGVGSVVSGFGLVFFGLARYFRFGLVLARFFFRFFVGFGSVQFGFLFIKPNRTGQFFQKFNQFNRFFFRFGFFGFFSCFLGLIGFLVFLLTPSPGCLESERPLPYLVRQSSTSQKN